MNSERVDKTSNAVRSYGSELRTVGKRLVALRGGASQRAFATELGIAVNTLGRYERGERLPDGEVLVKLRERGADLNWLLTGASIATVDTAFSERVQEPIAVKQWHDEKGIEARVKQAQEETAHLMHLCYQALDEHLEEQGKRMPPDKKADAVMVLLEVARREIEKAAAAGDARTEPPPSRVVPRDLLRRLVKLAA